MSRTEVLEDADTDKSDSSKVLQLHKRSTVRNTGMPPSRILFGIFLTMGLMIWASTASATMVSVHAESQVTDTNLGFFGANDELGTLSLDFSFDCDDIDQSLINTPIPVTLYYEFDDGIDNHETTTINTEIRVSVDGGSHNNITAADQLNWNGQASTFQYAWQIWVPEGFYSSCGEDCDITFSDNRVRIGLASTSQTNPIYAITGTVQCAPVVPEPSTLLLLGGGLAGLARMGWRHRKNG